MEVTTLPGIIQKNLRENPDFVAQYSREGGGDFKPTSYTEMYREILAYAAGLREIGIKRGDHIGFISDNRKEWHITSFALHCLGAVDVPRGCDSMAAELAYILSFGDCSAAVLENEAQMAKILPLKSQMPQLKMFIIIDNDFDKARYQADLSGITLHGYRDIMEKGKALSAQGSDASIEAEIEKGQSDDIATIIFTSGTTGEPKGVMLSHGNILNQSANAYRMVDNRHGDKYLAVLPVWHSFERTINYVAFHRAGAVAYSKPIGKVMLEDCAAIKPQWLPAVPRLWEAVRAGIYRNVASGSKIKKGLFNFFVAVGTAHQLFKDMLLGRMPHFRLRIVPFDMLVSIIPFLLLTPLRLLGNLLVFRKIQAKLGGRLRAGISGGAALPGAVDKFFAAAGIVVLEGYGITEAAPVLAVRNRHRPVRETIGPCWVNMEMIIRDPETGMELPAGKKGLVCARGPQIMKGYYKKPEETKKVIDSEGWLDTGDIGMRTRKGEFKITGRAKDTIVLLGGENLEPAPIEDKIRDSEYIDHAIVLGQDQKYLAALVVPNFERIETYAKENSISYEDFENLVKLPEIRKLIQSEIVMQVNKKTGFRGFEMIYRSVVVPKAFQPGVELSGKQDYKRHVITKMYKKEIAELFDE
ncbi:MAG: AMP-binding protein [Treponema sp.]|nr:AMP-binding protein [Treponema sp.]